MDSEERKREEKKRFPKKARLRKRSEFLRVYNEGKRLSSKHFLLHYLDNQEEGPRLGITVTKKCGNAVRRNRWKRLIREAYRLHRSKLPKVDLVVTVKRGVNPPSFGAAEKELLRLWRQMAPKGNRP